MWSFSHLSPDAVAELARAFGVRIRSWLAEELHGTLLGLLDEAGDTVGIGILQHIDFAHHRLEVLTAEGVKEFVARTGAELAWGQVVISITLSTVR